MNDLGCEEKVRFIYSGNNKFPFDTREQWTDSCNLLALREGVVYVRVLQPALHYELEQVSKIDILRKLKQRFGGKVIRDIRFRVG